MHPAKSVIYFTIATGAGYGLFFWLAVLNAMGLLPPTPLFGVFALGISFVLIVTGLLSSTLHLGHPERAWRALSQWRSSWLSREGVMAVLTFIPLAVFAIGWVFLQKNTGIFALFGLVGAGMSILTVFTTSMIYASLKAVPAWHNHWTKLAYLTLSLMSGAVIATALTQAAGLGVAAYHAAVPAAGLLVLGLLIKLFYWRHIGRKKPVSTAGTATGLGRFGKVSLAESPHDEDNYLLREMGFSIARKHAGKLRLIASILGFILPILLIGIAMTALQGLERTLTLIIATLSCMGGLTFERWLFFAQAKHAVTLFYGESEV